ncbi:hypothetical protein MMPV_002647 [Pyropia vietnamensis]
MSSAYDPISQDENLRLADLRYTASTAPSAAERENVAEQLKRAIIARKAVPLLINVSAELGWERDPALESKLHAAHDDDVGVVTKTLETARATLGETEVREALLSLSELAARSGSLEAATAAAETTIAATVGGGQKIDLYLSLARLAMVVGPTGSPDFPALAANLDAASALVEAGGDWERRNRLKVYRATEAMAKRDFDVAAGLLLDALATFTATELCSYARFVASTVLMAMVAVDRPTLVSRVASAPEVLVAIQETPPLAIFLTSLVECNYGAWMQALPDVLDYVAADRVLGIHTAYLARELRVVAYSQFLASYASVRIEAMCEAFGISALWLDRELASFIASGRLAAKIDRVGGVVVTMRGGSAGAAGVGGVAAMYSEVVKVGDGVLNRLQKLSRVIDV